MRPRPFAVTVATLQDAVRAAGFDPDRPEWRHLRLPSRVALTDAGVRELVESMPAHRPLIGLADPEGHHRAVS
jgi:hypothetical protein